ncbi:unnamed protein product [Amoebophrya sp. A120]|nr:unnamed protein product [Amoebophrya sp. A120]|eukprot:GSA120T00025127001.1
MRRTTDALTTSQKDRVKSVREKWQNRVEKQKDQQAKQPGQAPAARVRERSTPRAGDTRQSVGGNQREVARGNREDHADQREVDAHSAAREEMDTEVQENSPAVVQGLDVDANNNAAEKMDTDAQESPLLGAGRDDLNNNAAQVASSSSSARLADRAGAANPSSSNRAATPEASPPPRVPQAAAAAADTSPPRIFRNEEERAYYHWLLFDDSDEEEDATNQPQHQQDRSGASETQPIFAGEGEDRAREPAAGAGDQELSSPRVATQPAEPRSPSPRNEDLTESQMSFGVEQLGYRAVFPSGQRSPKSEREFRRQVRAMKRAADQGGRSTAGTSSSSSSFPPGSRASSSTSSG